MMEKNIIYNIPLRVTDCRNTVNIIFCNKKKKKEKIIRLLLLNLYASLSGY